MKPHQVSLNRFKIEVSKKGQKKRKLIDWNLLPCCNCIYITLNCKYNWDDQNNVQTVNVNCVQMLSIVNNLKTGWLLMLSHSL